MANIELSIPTTNVSVDINNTNVSVSSTTSNVNVGAAISARFTESVVDNGNIAGNVSFVATAGTIHKGTLTGNITGINFTGVETGQSFTLILEQNVLGGHILDLTTTPGNWTNYEFVNDFTTFDQTGGNFNIMNIVYDGTDFYASLVTDTASQASTGDIADGAVTNAKLANSNVIVNGTTFELGSSGNIANFGPLTTNDLTENTNLYFTTSRARASVSASGDLSYNSTTGVFSFTNDPGDIEGVTAGNGLTGGGTTGTVTLDAVGGYGITVNANDIETNNTEIRALISATGNLSYDAANGIISEALTTNDISEGTNLYFTDARARAALSATSPLSYNATTGVFSITEVGDIESVTAGAGLTGGGSTGNVTLDAVGGYGITVNADDIETNNTEIRALISATGNINYDAANGIISESLTTTDITEGDNQYFTTARANSAIGAYTGNLTAVSTTGNITTTANVSASHFIGSGTALTGVVPEALDTGKILLGSTSNTAIGVTPNSNFTSGSNAFNLANSLSGINSIESESASNITLHANTAKHTRFVGDMRGQNDVEVAHFDLEGYNPLVFAGANASTLPPTYSGSANLTSFVAEGNITSGSPNVVLSAGAELRTFVSGGTIGNATTLSAMLAGVSANYVFHIGSLSSQSQNPFPNGTVVSSVDAGNNIITMSNNATANVTLAKSALSGVYSNGIQNLLWVGTGAFDSTTGFVEQHYSGYDFTGNTSQRSEFPDVSGSDSSFAMYFNPQTKNVFGYGPNGPQKADLTYTTGDDANYTAGGYTMIGRVSLKDEADKMYPNFEYGLTVGGAQPSNRIFGDIDTVPSINQLWDGTGTWSQTSWYNNPQIQYGIRAFTDNSSQAAASHLGPRLFFASSKGNINDSAFEWYPETGQELGRISFWGTHGNNPTPPQLSPPAYFSAQASDDWDNGSNCSVYLVGTSNWTGDSSREPFVSYHRGNLILTSGQLSNSTSHNAGITFAPSRQTSSNPADTYDFAGNSAATAQQTFGLVNYANVSANSGAKISVTHGASLGAGTVGDQVIELKRNDNTISGTVDFSSPGAVRWLINAADSNTFLELANFGLPISDTIRIEGTSNATTINNDLLGKPVTFTGITNSNWLHYNNNTFVLRTIGFSPFFAVFDAANANPITSSNTSSLSTVMDGAMSFNTSTASGVVASSYNLTLPEQESNLHIKSGDTTTIKIAGTSTAEFTNIPVVPTKTVAELANTTATAGGIAFCNNETGGAVLVFADGTSWRRSTDRANVS